MAVWDAEYAIKQANEAMRDSRTASSVGDIIHHGNNAIALMLGALLLEVAGLRAELKERS